MILVSCVTGRPLIIWGAWCEMKKKFVRRVAEKNPSKGPPKKKIMFSQFHPKKFFFVIKKNFFGQFWPKKIKIWFGGSPKKKSFAKIRTAPPQMINGRPLMLSAAEHHQNVKAMDMILKKIVEDPHSSSCQSISYQDYEGPFASLNPTGSSFAANPLVGTRQNLANGAMNNNVGNMSDSVKNLTLNAAAQAAGNMAAGAGGGAGGQGGNNQALENVKATLRGSGYTEQAVEEITSAMHTLANYGLLGLVLGLMNLKNGELQNLAKAGFSDQAGQKTHGHQGNINLGILSFISNNAGSPSFIGNGSNAPSADSNPSVIGPVRSTTTTMAGGDTGEGNDMT